jgi:hypothetical protein
MIATYYSLWMLMCLHSACISIMEPNVGATASDCRDRAKLIAAAHPAFRVARAVCISHEETRAT